MSYYIQLNRHHMHISLQFSYENQGCHSYPVLNASQTPHSIPKRTLSLTHDINVKTYVDDILKYPQRHRCHGDR